MGVLVAGQSTIVAQAQTGVDMDARRCIVTPASSPAGFKPWQLDRLGIRDLWKMKDAQGRPLDGTGVSIAVIDTGVSNVNTAYFDTRNVTTLNYMPPDENAEKDGLDCDHGTAVTALIVAKPDSDPRTNFSGVAPGAKVVAMRTLMASEPKDGVPQGNPAHIVAAIDDAIARKVQIINISQSMPRGTADYEKAIQRALDAGIVVVAAAGNVDDQVPARVRGPLYPANYPGVVSVGNTTPDDQPSPGSYSHPNQHVTIAAPGTLVMSLLPSAPGDDDDTQAYAQLSGTSFAAPLVTGVVALMLQKEPGLTPAQVKQRLMETADPPTRTLPDPQVGNGVLNPMRALTGVMVDASQAPRPTPSYTPVVETPPPTPDPTPTRVAIGAAVGAGVLAVVGLVLRIVLPAAGRRGFRAADR